MVDEIMEEHVYDLIPGYALGSLDEEDLILVSRHLSHCATCRKDLDAYAETVEALAYAVPVMAPPQGLRERVIRRAGDTALGTENAAPVAPASTGVPAGVPARPGIQEFFRSLFGSPLALAAGLAVILVLVLGINTVILSNRVKKLQTAAPVQGEMRLVRLAGTEHDPQAVGYLIVFKDEKYGTLAVENAAVLDPAQQYQIWLIKDGVRTSGGVFSVNKVGYGVLEIWSERPLEEYQSFGITIEPAGGSPQPTGKKVLGGDL
jgi:anti-sigma-K factor RskA